MKGNIKYKILPNIRMSLILYSGEISIDMVKSHLQKMGTDELYDPEFNAITDFGDSIPMVNNKEIEEIITFMRSADLVIGERRQAFIFRTPKHQAISSIFSMLAREIPVTFDVVSDLRQAMEFIGMSILEFNLVEDAFREMKES